MARAGKLTKPDRTRLIKLQVLRSVRVTPHFQRVTLGGGTIEHFVPMGYDQWFRLFIPTEGDVGLDQLPDKVSTIGYLKYLRIKSEVRPVLRNYTVRQFRADGPDGPELDIDFVLHDSTDDDSNGPGATWAESCAPGDWVGIIDEGLVYDPELGHDDLLLITDESGVPAVAGILASLPTEAAGLAILEVPSADDVVEISSPAGVELRWLVREDGHTPGADALAALTTVDVRPGVHAFTVGESALATGARRHLVTAGVPKDRINFCGYWKVGAHA